MPEYNNPWVREIHWRSYGETDLTIYTIAFFILTAIFFLSSDKKYALIGFLPFGFLVSVTQRLVILGLDFPTLRILVILGILRLMLRNEFRRIQLNAMDLTIIAFAVISTINHTILKQSSGALILKLGESFELLGLYFFFRIFFSHTTDFLFSVKLLIPITIIFATFMVIENFTQSNYFSYFGGQIAPVLREGRLRCAAAFHHSILAGSYAAAVVPFFIALFWQNVRNKTLAAFGIISAFTMIYFSASSGPALSLIASLAAWGLWFLRKYLRHIRWLIVGIILILSMIMNAPVWHLISRISVVGGSTGYHRFLLIDRTITHFWEWWLFGSNNVKYWGWGLEDMTHQFIGIGLTSGLFPMLLYIILLLLAFQTIGNINYILEKESKAIRFLYWGLGVSLFTHIVSFMSVSYFDQTKLLLYLQLGYIATCREMLFRKTNIIRWTRELILLKSSKSHLSPKTQ